MTTLLSTSSLFTAKGLFLLQLVILCLTKLQKGVIQNHIFVNCASNNVVFSGRNRGVTNNGGFNYEIEKRVHERVSELMNKPVTMLGLVERFAQTDIFEPPVLRPHQKDDFFRILWTIWKEFGIDLYYGQEDGLFLGVIKGAGTYQEGRGSNGYLLDEEVASDEEKYMKRLYFNKCLDRETGISENCTLKEDEDYVSCVNSCKLAPCPSSVEGEYNNTSNSSSTIYCPTYEILQAPTSGMGYIPRYYYCLSNSGRFIENDPPNSVESPSHIRNGLCTHTDGVTLVNGRTSEKQTYAMADRRNYVFLREYDDGMAENYTSNNGDEAAALLYSDVAIADGQKTDQVFVGGYHSRRYEPRLRPWYIGTRELQNAFWTKPYPFATANDIGITYGKPLYYTDPTSGAKVFRGVIAVDYDLEEISRFLIDVFLAVEDQSEEETSDMNRYSSSSGATVLIVEDDGPHYIIGSSTGSKAAKKVRVEDESIDCDDDEIWSGDIECKTVRSTPEDFSHNNTRSNNNQNGVTQDAILALAFKAQKEAGFPKELVVSSPREEGYSYTNADGNSNFYVSQSLIYEQLEGQNLRWRIIVVMPVAVATNGELLWGDPMTAVVLTVALLGFGICIVLFYIYFSKRKALHVTDSAC
ncbi:unnamed protein product [Pseudo-nitzschia multistriata]|uniref:Uncharacterized protein n=1 Tax=Pseudo-nitzschia multistriata TaxID=183589 RepID=A0A448ZDI2_9STRA|nr:unnamed protein product [Pseudo-nitzschia multistriata]